MEFRIKKAKLNDVHAVAALIRAVWEQMDNREWFVMDEADFLKDVLESGRGFIYMAIDAGTEKLAGVMDILTPGLEKDNLGYDAGFREEKLLSTAHVDSVAILPEYRGMRLQAILMEAAEQELAVKGYRYMMCTVHPDNSFSRNNMVRQGYRAVCRKEKYGGRIRDVMLKELPGII